jgi:hypothetical protein
MGAEVLVVEPTVWLGGMLTSAGVSALDGNKYGAGGGLVKEFRDRLADHYGSIESLFTGWISLYCYEPHVGERILREFVAPLGSLDVLFESDVVRYESDGSVRLVDVRGPGGEITRVACGLFVDATEYGDGMALAGIPYRLGRESGEELGESAAPEAPDLELQDLTYAATLVEDRSAPPPADVSDSERAYWKLFQCSTLVDCPDPDEKRLNHTIHSWDSFIGYARLPNNKVLLNWPHHSNDFPMPVAMFEDRYYRRRHLAAARLHTLQYIKYMQTALGHPEWRIATDEYPSEDHLPLIPYIRESRRLVNGRVMVQDDVVAVEGRPRAPMVPDAISVGDYFLDHHHSKHHLPPDRRMVEDFPSSAPFQIPLRVVFPGDDVDERFIVGEKSIAVSHIVNGGTRLQPPVMLTGQAIGALTAMATAEGRLPSAVPIRSLQEVLIEAGCQLYIAYDVPAGHPAFAAVQRLALAGVLRDDDPTRLEPDAKLAADVAQKWADRAGAGDMIGLPAQGVVEASDLADDVRVLLPPGSEGAVARGDYLELLDRLLRRRGDR